MLSVVFSYHCLFYVDGFSRSTISSIDLESDNITEYNLQTDITVDHQLHGILKSENDGFFVTCTKQRKTYKVMKNEQIVLLEDFCGSGEFSYGMGNECSFIQPTAMVSEGNSIIVVDTGPSSMSNVSPSQPLWMFLDSIRQDTKLSMFTPNRKKNKHSYQYFCCGRERSEEFRQ